MDKSALYRNWLLLFLKKSFGGLLLISLAYCNQHKKTETFYAGHQRAVILDEATVQKAEFLPLTTKNISGQFTDIHVVDSFLLCGHLRSPKLIAIYSLTTNQLLSEVITRGTSRHEGLSVASFYSAGDASAVWVYDITSGKLFKIDVLKASGDTAYIPEKEILLTGKLKNLFTPSSITDSTILATTYSLDHCRYLYTDAKNILKKVGELPSVRNDKLLRDRRNTKFPNRAYLFKSKIVKHPRESKVAVFYNKADRVEFYQNDSLQQTIIGPDRAGIQMAVSHIEEGNTLSDFGKTRYAYTSVCATQESIYSLYAGQQQGETCSSQLFVFDWTGQVKRILTLDKPVCAIAIDARNEILYCYSDAEKSIFFVNLK